MVGNRTEVKVAKSKVGAPFKVAQFDIMYGKGVSREGGVLDLAVDMGVVKQSGSWFNYGDVKLGQGREKAKTYLSDNPDTLAEIETLVRDTLGI